MTDEKNKSTQTEGWIANIFGPLIAPKDLPKVLRCSRPQSDRIKRQPGFPKPVHLSERMPRWKAHEVEAWIEAQAVEVAE